MKVQLSALCTLKIPSSCSLDMMARESAFTITFSGPISTQNTVPENEYHTPALQISTAKLQLYYDKKDVLWILLRQLAVYYNLLYPYFLKVIFVTTDCHRKYDF